MSLAVTDWVLLGGILLLALLLHIFLRQMFSLALLLAALWIAWHFRTAGGLLADYIEDPTLQQVLAFAAITLGIVLFGAFAGYVAERLLLRLGIAPLMRIGNFMLSVTLSFLLASGALGIVRGLPLTPPLTQRDWWQQSRLMPGVLQAGTYLREGLRPAADAAPSLPASGSQEER